MQIDVSNEYKRQKKESILLIDDDRVGLELVGDIVLTAIDTTVIEATDWDEAIERAVKDRPFMIILNLFFSTKREGFSPYLEELKKAIIGEKTDINDVDTTRKDGFSLSLTLKENPLTAPIPLLGIGPMDIEYLHRLAIKAKCNDYLGKPFGMRELIDKINGLLVSLRKAE